jgi:hypothetical protein
MTVAEFQERIRQQCGAPAIRPENPLLTRKPTDRGFNPPKLVSDHEKKEIWHRGIANNPPKTKQIGGKI